MKLISEMRTTENSEHTEMKRVAKGDTAHKVRIANSITISSSVYSVYSVVRHLSI